MTQGSLKHLVKHQIVYFTICYFGILVFLMALLVTPSVARHQRRKRDYDGGLARETVHEQLGQLHFPSTGFTVYRSNATYTQDVNHSIELVRPLFNLTQYIFDNILLGDTPLPPGYVVVKDNDTVVLGPKAKENDWTDLLAKYWLTIFWVMFLLALIICMPIVAICYCCTCCWTRCPKGCPPCETTRDSWKRSCWGLLLAILIIEILVAVLMAFDSNRLFKYGLDYTAETLRRASADTCTFLRDITDHVEHLFITNYDEMDFHLTDIIRNAHTHMFLDVMDVSEANAVFEIERILNNIEKAQKLFEDLDKLETDLRFYGAQLKDGVRGIKRDLFYACTVLCGNKYCLQFLQNMAVQKIDTSSCLHFDKLPDTLSYLEATDEILDIVDINLMPSMIARLQPFEANIKAAIDPITPPMLRDLHNGEGLFREQATLIRNTINVVISDIHFNTLRSTKSFEDLNEKFGLGRHTINVGICIIICIILGVLVVALICGCCASFQGAHKVICCTRGVGSFFLIFAIIMIFCAFSFMLLIGLFYFIFGVITYQGACEPLRDYKTNPIFHQMDSDININRYTPKSLLAGNSALPPLRMSTALEACHEDKSIFKLLEDKHVYNIEDIIRTEVIGEYEIPTTPVFPANISNFFLITDNDYFALEDVWLTNLSSYHSDRYLDVLCTKLTPVELPKLASQVRELASSLLSKWGYFDLAKVALRNEADNLEQYHDEFVPKIVSLIEQIREKVENIDDLILYNGNNFGKSLKMLELAAERSEDYMRANAEKYARQLRENLSYFIQEEVDDYMDMVITRSTKSVGKCSPLAHVYSRSVDWICERLVDPMNGFWFSIQLICILLIPTLFASHQLVCLYRKKYRPVVLPRFVTREPIPGYRLPPVQPRKVVAQPQPQPQPVTQITKEVRKKVVRFNIVNDETNTDDVKTSELPSTSKNKEE